MDVKKVVVAGGGVLGSQIAYQTAYKGFDVTLWLRSDASVERAKPRIAVLHERYAQDLAIMNTPAGKSPFAFARGLADDPATFTEEAYKEAHNKNEQAFANLKYETDLAKAVEDADVIIESMSENPEEKIAFYEKLAPLLPQKTIILTNSSTLLPSMFAQSTGRPEKYASLHFANTIWKRNTAEVMGHDGTPAALLDEICVFAKQIGMIPLKLNKEQPGYLLNSMLVPLISSAIYLWANDVSDVKTIDLTWKLGTGAPKGPFEIIDTVGIKTIYNIESMKPGADDPSTTQGYIVQRLKERVDAGLLGLESGEGFYKY